MFISIIAFIFCLVIGVPIAFCLGISSTLLLLLSKGIPLGLIAQRMFTGLDVFPFMAIPFFILAGELMNQCQITPRLVHFSDLLVGRLKGGLGHVNIVVSMFFSGITGSAVADTAAIGSILIPAMEEKGFDSEFSAAVTASSSVIGPIIPPSIPMVIYGLITGTSIGALFLAGFIPGVTLGFALMGACYYLSRKRNYPRREHKISMRELLIGSLNAIIPLIMPIIIMGGILGGVFTATEASAVAVVYALFIGFLVYRNLKPGQLPKIFIATAKTTGVVFMVIACSNIFNWLLATEQVPQNVANFFTQNIESRVALLLVINLILLAVGTFMDATAAMIILVPVLLQVTSAFDIHPVMFGAIVVLNLMIGLLTPPVGLCLFVACGIANLSLERIARAVLPFLAVEIAVLLMVTYFEPMTLFLPRFFGYIN
jgi:tripartite ATP-independent transporter DctM subunit